MPLTRRLRTLLSLLAAAALLAGCLGTVKHARCKRDFDDCSNQCEPICEREGAATNDPYTDSDPGGIRELGVACSDCVRACHKKAAACDKAEDDRYNQQVPPE